MGEWTFGGIDEQDDAIDHREHAFDFAAEIGVTRCVGDVDLDAIPFDSRSFADDRNAAFAFQCI